MWQAPTLLLLWRWYLMSQCVWSRKTLALGCAWPMAGALTLAVTLCHWNIDKDWLWPVWHTGLILTAVTCVTHWANTYGCDLCDTLGWYLWLWPVWHTGLILMAVTCVTHWADTYGCDLCDTLGWYLWLQPVWHTTVILKCCDLCDTLGWYFWANISNCDPSLKPRVSPFKGEKYLPQE